ncbi:RES family NAD+ phosphorylase [Rothia sp. LK2492]|uniref:RES family NAD+ phosphorylase n=1 Tax=Rothia sp. LK2492 TaxID=3114370 RepID=UPI0034CE0511
MGNQYCNLCLGDDLFKVLDPNTWSFSSKACCCCDSTNQKLVGVDQLPDYFEWARVIYRPTEKAEGKPLLSWLKSDWGLLSTLYTSQANLLLQDIFSGDTFDVLANLLPDSLEDEKNSERWREHKEEIQHRNRWPLGAFGSDVSLFEEVVNYLSRLEEASVAENYYRARIHDSEESFEPKDLGAPPREKAGHGRLNPAGIPYLYLASEKSTAIAEVRPHPGQKVVTASFQIDTVENEGLKIADLVQVASLFSPFDYLESTPILRARDFQEMVREIADEFSRPVRPDAAPYRYVPTQYLCELLKRKGFDGVAYSSALAEGHNLVLFEPEKFTAQPETLQEHDISSVHVDYRTLK